MEVDKQPARLWLRIDVEIQLVCLHFPLNTLIYLICVIGVNRFLVQVGW